MDRIQCNTILFLLIIQLLLLYVNLSQSKDNNNFPNYAIRVNKRDAQSGTPNINNTVAKEPLKCNGDAAICDLRYDQVVKIARSFFFFKEKDLFEFIKVNSLFFLLSLSLFVILDLSRNS